MQWIIQVTWHNSSYYFWCLFPLPLNDIRTWCQCFPINTQLAKLWPSTCFMTLNILFKYYFHHLPYSTQMPCLIYRHFTLFPLSVWQEIFFHTDKLLSKKHIFSNKTSLGQLYQLTKVLCCFSFGLILLFIDIIFWCWYWSLFKIYTYMIVSWI